MIMLLLLKVALYSTPYVYLFLNDGGVSAHLNTLYLINRSLLLLTKVRPELDSLDLGCYTCASTALSFRGIHVESHSVDT